jgi:hypothetical protein
VELSRKLEILESDNKDLKDALVLKIGEAEHLKKSNAILPEKNMQLETRCMYPVILFLY